MARFEGWPSFATTVVDADPRDGYWVQAVDVDGDGRMDLVASGLTRGEVVWYRGVINQDGKVVQEGEIVTLIECRPLSRSGAAAEADAAPAPSPNGTV